MVYPVQAVPRVSRTRRENGSSKRRQPGSSKNVTFTDILEKTMAENQPLDCYIVTYNVDKELQTYYYQPTREYTL